MKESVLNWSKVIHYTQKGNLVPDRRVEKTKEEWKDILTPEQFRITREHGTERAFSGEHCTSYDAGIYVCVCCKNELFDSSMKFDSGSGWPSFDRPVQDNAMQYIKDDSMGMKRVETRCNTCDAHLGHVFSDGPSSNGLRFCINSEAIEILK